MQVKAKTQSRSAQNSVFFINFMEIDFVFAFTFRDNFNTFLIMKRLKYFLKIQRQVGNFKSNMYFLF